MATEFIGYSILVTLRVPKGAQVSGRVQNVVEQRLVLEDVTLKWNNQRFPRYILDAAEIADLEIAPSQSEDDLATPTAPARTAQVQPQFIDPAIVSYGKAPARPPQSLMSPVSPIMIADGSTPSFLRNNSQQTLRGQSSISSISTAKAVQRRASRRDSTNTATLNEPFDAMTLQEQTRQSTNDVTGSEKRSRTGRSTTGLQNTAGSESSNKRQAKGSGWRNDPLIKERPSRARGRAVREDVNGWGTEDATDIAEMGDFDFTQNLAKFDKRKVFDDIRRDDTTADEDRLVSHNRSRPGTNNGKNLHFSENVLDVPDLNDTNRWKSEAGETEDEIKEDHYSSGRSKRGHSRKPMPSRKGSTLPHLSPQPLSRKHTGSPLPTVPVKSTLRVASTSTIVHAVSPLQMLELEQLCVTELLMSEELLTENAGRSIANAILTSLTLTPNNLSTKAVLFLIGNHKTGARALAAARHLRNRRVKTKVCILGHERTELLDSVSRQLEIYQKCSGRVETWDLHITKPTAPSDIVVDAILGIHSTFDELRTDDQATAFSMIKSSDTYPLSSIVSLDIPSGVSASTGLTTALDDTPLRITPGTVLCLGAPKTGLLTYLSDLALTSRANGNGSAANGTEQRTCNVFVLDVGVPYAAWQKMGSRRRQGIDWGEGYILPLTFSVS